MANPAIRIRRIQPRLRYKQHPSLRVIPIIPTSRNILFLVLFIFTASFCLRKLQFFPSSNLSSTSHSSFYNSPPAYEHGLARVDRVIWYEGHSLHNRTTEQQTPTHIPNHSSSQQSQHLETQIDSLHTKNHPSAQHYKSNPANLSQIAEPPPQPDHDEHIQHSDNHHSSHPVEPKSLKEILHFTPATAINFMHFHKTGGVSFKTSLHMFYHKKVKKNGQPVKVRDACYTREGVKDEPSRPTFILWRCDWEPLRQMTEEQRNEHDFVFGHQFWRNGAGVLLNKRDLRSFTILRHPFDRKVSFYYHFFVREVGRKEKDVTFEDIKNFLLYDKLTIKANLGRDLGPNYMAGRLLSDGTRGFVGNSSYAHYAVAQENKITVAEEANNLLREYLFVGLQKESKAAKCMLRKVVEAFNEVNGISNDGVERIDGNAAVLNRGSYSMSAEDIWKRFTEDEKILFDRKERIDLLIYEEGEQLFRKHVKLFGCTDQVQDTKYK